MPIPSQDLPAVSVIMNCLNGEQYLREALDSVVAQTYPDWEIVFWDNASQDTSAAIAKSYGGRVRYFRGETTVPLGAARNLAIAEATWVLASVYELDARAIATAVEMLVSHAHLTVQDSEVVAAAAAQFRLHPRVGFSDCLMVEIARKAGHLPLGTFDRDLGKFDGAQRL